MFKTVQLAAGSLSSSSPTERNIAEHVISEERRDHVSGVVDDGNERQIPADSGEAGKIGDPVDSEEFLQSDSLSEYRFRLQGIKGMEANTAEQKTNKIDVVD